MACVGFKAVNVATDPTNKYSKASFSTIMPCLQFAVDNKADIINCSFRITGNNTTDPAAAVSDRKRFFDLFNSAAKSCLIVCAAGNQQNDHDKYSSAMAVAAALQKQENLIEYNMHLNCEGNNENNNLINNMNFSSLKIPSVEAAVGNHPPLLVECSQYMNFSSLKIPSVESAVDNHPPLSVECSLDDILVVASTNALGELSCTSDYGSKTVHISAPGAHIIAVNHRNDVVFCAGTSFAAPHVSGSLALLCLIRPASVSVTKLREIVLESTVDKDVMSRIGFGRLNLTHAIEKLLLSNVNSSIEIDQESSSEIDANR